MLQQPVVRELRSFQSLSRFSGPRALVNRRQSSINARRYSHSRQRAADFSIDEQVFVNLFQFLYYSFYILSYLSDQRRHAQVEWSEEADFIDEECELPYPGFVEPALHCLYQANPPRSWALQMVMNPWFDRITMFVILINCVTLGMYRPCEDGPDCTTYRCYILSIIDHSIFVYFSLEMIVKIIALGFCGQAAYLSDTWNRLDFFIVCAGCAEYLLQEYLGNINLTAIRTIRVLRPLRAVNRIPSMRILGLEMVEGIRKKNEKQKYIHETKIFNCCFYRLPQIFQSVFKLIIEETSLDYICSQSDSSGLHTCHNLPPYKVNGIRCNLTINEWSKVSDKSCINWNIYYDECKVMNRNPFQGSVSFDNIGFAWVAIFLVISLEGWTDIMYYVQDAHSFWNWIYFVLLIVVGAFFMINLCLVVIATQFAETKRRETERMLEERKRMRSSGSLSGSEIGVTSSKDGGAGDSIYAAIVKIIRHLSRRAKRKAIRVCVKTLESDKMKKGSLFIRVRMKIREFVLCNHFKRGILFAILVNTLSMGVEYHEQPEILTMILECSNYFFTGLFALEMLLKIIADGLFDYLSDGFNLFDGGIVALSVIELFQEGKGGLSVLRTFRLLRILKLVRFMPALRYQLVVMLRTMDNVTVFFGLLILFIFIFSILGMNLFGCKFCKIEDTINSGHIKRCERKNFDSLLWALVTVFQILTQEDWNMVLFNGMSQTSPWAALYFVTLMTFGNYVLFNLLVAILVEGFQESKEEEKRQLNRHTSLVLPRSRQRMNSWCELYATFNPNCPIHNRQALLEAYVREKLIKASQELHKAIVDEELREERRKNTRWRRFLRNSCIHKRSDYSLFMFSPKNRLRIRCLQLIQKKWFDYAVLFCIGVNCVTLAMERPSIPPKSLERQFLTISGYIFTCIFAVEMFIKMIANGCIFGKGSYFKDGWNILDGNLVIISLINIIFELLVHTGSPKIFGVIRVLRLLRALRPLRVINRAPGVKLVVMTLISSLKPIGNIVLICCTFFIIFGILGVQLFKGMMFHCIGPEIANVTTKSDCLHDPRNKWVNHRYNFDNLGQALMSLFVLSSKDGWVAIMYQGIDATGVDLQPIENYNEWRMIYFISFLLLVGFFVLNMFVGVVVENFHKCKEALEAEMKERARQKRIERRLKGKDSIKKKSFSYWRGYGQTRLFLHDIVMSKYFDLAIAAVIGINVISMAMEFYMMPPGLKYVLKALNYFFTAIFALESGMKLIALGIKRFFRERWNQLDIFIVFLSIAGIIFEEFEALELPINPTIIRVMRVLRIARVLKLLKMAKGIRSLLDTVGEALPQVGNLGSLFFLLFFIFAALGVELFGKLECSEEHPCDGLGEHAHFKNFGMAFLTLFRIATGDNWNGIMKDALRDDCNPSDRCEVNCCVDPILAPCFFIIFVLISQFVLVNVVVAVLMKHLEESNKKEEAIDGITTDTDINKTDTDMEDNRDSAKEIVRYFLNLCPIIVILFSFIISFVVKK
ncbi:unnamed protein product [Dracunculus medinensis]|uniref:Voltage-dependent T-type calcium channel subunit alpha n=1 Tax=Dracunculus medinensis TaxID=318479 RepID=A0A158Q408_DRAME|nr:unnamed protein product [Dracunculus medinensis]